MAIRQIGQVIEQIRRDLSAESTDSQLLGRFVSDRDDVAFATLVRRHGALVWGVCRRTLADHHDAEDCFQAVFLVLARKAASIASRELLANWLHGVARNAARKAAAANRKRRTREKQVEHLPEMAAAEGSDGDLAALLDLELSRLPEKYRVPVLLCELHGKTHQEAARQLGWPIGTLSGRLSRARTMLAQRLARRGLVLTAAALAGLATPAAASAGLIASTVGAASGLGTELVSARVTSLVEGVLKAMLLRKLRNIAIMALVVAAAVGGWCVFAGATPTTPPTQQEAKLEQAAGEPRPTVSPPKIIVGDNYLVFPVTTDLQRFRLGAATKALVLVDGASVVRADGTLDGKALDFRKLGEALKGFDRKGHVVLTACFGNPNGDERHAIDILYWALEGFARREGFATASGMVSYSVHYDWKAQVAAASKEEVVAEETATGNKLVTVYAVRTVTSRALTGADCVVDILPPSDQWENGELSQAVRHAIHLYVGKLNLPRKGHVLFQLHRTPGMDAKEIEMRFVRDTAQPLATSLGFEASSTSY